MTAFPFELMIALMHMIGEGVFDRYPRLKVAFMEGGCGWIPFWAHRLDEHSEKLRPQWPALGREPSAVIKSEQVSFTCEAGEPEIPYVLDAIGESQVMCASDYAHWDCEFPESVKMVTETPGLNEERTKLVLGQNAIRWFNLAESELPDASVYFGRDAGATTRQVLSSRQSGA